jgi:hypothetical protein
MIMMLMIMITSTTMIMMMTIMMLMMMITSTKMMMIMMMMMMMMMMMITVWHMGLYRTTTPKTMHWWLLVTVEGTRAISMCSACRSGKAMRLGDAI